MANGNPHHPLVNYNSTTPIPPFSYSHTTIRMIMLRLPDNRLSAQHG